MKSTLVATAIAVGVLSMPVAAAQPRTTSTPVQNTSVAAPTVAQAAVTAGAASSATTQALNTMRNIPVAGTTASGNAFHGALSIVNFQNVNGRIMAITNISGRLVRPNGTIVGRVTNIRAQFPVTLSDGTSVHSLAAPNQTGSCDILHLRLGAINLNLLGLVVHLDPVRLDITAQPGPGNLLGNLLCAVSGLLDQTGVNNVLVDLLRAIRQILNGL
jgi:hypothetical protein